MSKPCPACKNHIPSGGSVCSCGHDANKEVCPGCDKSIPDTALTCPFCLYDLVDDRPHEILIEADDEAEEVVASATATLVKQRRPRRKTVSSPSATTVIRSTGRTAIPNIGIVGDFPELHFAGEPTDTNLRRWADKVKEAWQRLTGSALMNVGVEYLADTADERVLRKNSKRILELIGGDDWK